MMGSRHSTDLEWVAAQIEEGLAVLVLALKSEITSVVGIVVLHSLGPPTGGRLRARHDIGRDSRDGSESNEKRFGSSHRVFRSQNVWSEKDGFCC